MTDLPHISAISISSPTSLDVTWSDGHTSTIELDGALNLAGFTLLPTHVVRSDGDLDIADLQQPKTDQKP